MQATRNSMPAKQCKDDIMLAGARSPVLIAFMVSVVPSGCVAAHEPIFVPGALP